jgi:uncharacterized protein YbjQ (UPF0145 family)
MGAKIVCDVFATITDMVGDRSSAYETKLSHAGQVSLAEMEQNAVVPGANAIVGGRS